MSKVNIKKIIKWFLIMLVVLIVLIFGTCHLLSKAMCETSEFERIGSPSGRLDAVIYQIDCGASTDFNSQVSIVDKGDQGDTEDAIVVVDSTNRNNSLYYKKGGPILKVSWISETELNISMPKNSRTYNQQSKFDDIKINYSKYE